MHDILKAVLVKHAFKPSLKAVLVKHAVKLKQHFEQVLIWSKKFEKGITRITK